MTMTSSYTNLGPIGYTPQVWMNALVQTLRSGAEPKGDKDWCASRKASSPGRGPDAYVSGNLEPHFCRKWYNVIERHHYFDKDICVMVGPYSPQESTWNKLPPYFVGIRVGFWVVTHLLKMEEEGHQKKKGLTHNNTYEARKDLWALRKVTPQDFLNLGDVSMDWIAVYKRDCHDKIHERKIHEELSVLKAFILLLM